MKVERQIQRMENNNYTINSNVFRSNMSTFGSGASYMRSIHQYSTSHNLNSGLSDTGATIASSIRDTREREKREMADLNDRLASYIEKVRFLEAQNRKLATDLEALRSRWGSDTTSVKMMCESEIKTAHTLIDDSNRQREGLEQEIRRLITELNDMKKKYEEAVLNRQASRQDADALLMKLAEIEAEINLIRRRILVVEDEIARIKRENQRLSGELSCNKTGIETELASRITFENRVKSLLEDCEVLGRQQATEMNELVVQAHRDTTPENREYFKKELSAAIREIRSEYDKISSATRQDMDSWYRKMVIEIQNQSKASSLEQNQAREEIKRHRDSLTEMRRKLSEMEGRNLMLEKQIQELNYALEDEHRSYEAAISDRDASIRKMREDCQALMLELQTLLDTKTSLDAEIAIYRKMMVEEENRGSLRHLIDENIARQDTTVLGGVFESRRVIQTESHASSTGRFIGSATSRITSSSTDH